MADLNNRLKSVLKTSAYWLLPQGLQELFRKQARHYLRARKLSSLPFLQDNIKFKDCHQGERCFILCTGPSIQQQDLTLLKDEFCISVSNFYVHKDYNTIRPHYHCIPDVIAGHPQYVTEEYVVRWFQEMEAKIGDTILFMSCSGKDKELIDKYGLFSQKEVYYLYFSDNWDEVPNRGIDLTRYVPSKQSVSVMALEVAIYMGFTEIYLLGCDHDYILHFGESRHFYAEKNSVLATRPSYSEWQDVDFYVLFECSLSLWKQYQIILQYAQKQNINIYNATAGGILDIFLRVNYESLF